MGSGISEANETDAGNLLGEQRGKPVPVGSTPAAWLKENLFANVANTVLTLVGGLATALVLRGVLNFVFSEERRWDAVRTNLRALMTLAYPESQYARIWVSVAVLVTLAGLSSGLWANWGTIRVQRLCGWVMSLGGFIILCILLREPSALVDDKGIVLLDSFSEPVRESFGSAMMSRSTWWIVGISFVGSGCAGWCRLDKSGRTKVVSATSTVLGSISILYNRDGLKNLKKKCAIVAYQPPYNTTVPSSLPLTTLRNSSINHSLLLICPLLKWSFKSARS